MSKNMKNVAAGDCRPPLRITRALYAYDCCCCCCWWWWWWWWWSVQDDNDDDRRNTVVHGRRVRQTNACRISYQEELHCEPKHVEM